MYLLLGIIFSLSYTEIAFGGEQSGNIIVKTVGKCPAHLMGDGLITYNVKLQRVSRSKLFVLSNITTLAPIDDETGVHNVVSKKTNQGYKENFFWWDVDSVCKYLLQVFPALSRQIYKIVHVKGCPIPPGNYTSEILVNLFNEYEVPTFLQGSFRSRIQLISKNKKVMTCLQVEVDIKPRISG